MGDSTTYEYTCLLRAVTSEDGMTADYFNFPSSFLDHGVRTIGYENEIVFPIELKIKDANKKIITDINIEYLICKF